MELSTRFWIAKVECREAAIRAIKEKADIETRPYTDAESAELYRYKDDVKRFQLYLALRVSATGRYPI